MKKIMTELKVKIDSIDKDKLLSDFKEGASASYVVAKETGKHIAQGTKKIGIATKDKIDNLDLVNTKARETAMNDYNELLKEYNKEADQLELNAIDLYQTRITAVSQLKEVEDHLTEIANKPKDILVELKKISFEITTFESKITEIRNAEKEAKLALAGSTASASLSGLGVAVAALGPSAAMGIATTFGVASTGTAISSLSGAVATNAALAWLGGGTLAAGGGGISAGAAFLALAGPIGWTVAGLGLSSTVGTSIFANNKNKKITKELVEERNNLALVRKKTNLASLEIESLISIIETQTKGLLLLNQHIKKRNYIDFTEQEKIQAGLLVNSALTLAELLNKEVSINV